MYRCYLGKSVKFEAQTIGRQKSPKNKRRIRHFWQMFLNNVDRNCRPFHRKSCLADTAVDFSAISCNWSCSQVLHCYGFEIHVIKVTSLKLCDVDCFRFFSVEIVVIENRV